MDSSNTAQNRAGKPFTKNDPRINRKGRPRTFDALRELAQQIAHETVKNKDGDPVVVEGHIATVTEVILRKWAASGDPRLQMAFVEVAYGKEASKVELTGKDGAPLKAYVSISPDDWEDATSRTIQPVAVAD